MDTCADGKCRSSRAGNEPGDPILDRVLPSIPGGILGWHCHLIEPGAWNGEGEVAKLT